MELANKKVLVLGAGISGSSVAGVLQKKGAQVTLSDAKPLEKLKNKDFSEITALGVTLAFGDQTEALLNGVEYLVVSPGISIEIPLVHAARRAGICVMSEVEVAYRLCPAPILAVTGTNGKTTTTTLLGEMMKTSNSNVVVGGNIGQALSKEVEGVTAEGLVVAEISSFQLEGSIDFKPHVAAILNITPDHLDRHYTLANYAATKERIFARQAASDYLVLNYDDEIVRAMAGMTKAQVFFFSRKQTLKQGIFVKDNVITIAWAGKTLEVCPVSRIKLLGEHNVENVLAACAAAYLAGVSPDKLVTVIDGFTGVEHRIEEVCVVNGVTYYNDSKATNPESSVKALESFSGHVILLAGGRDKNTDLREFMSLIKAKTDHLILLGEAAERFKAAAVEHGVENIHEVSSLKAAVELAHKLAKAPQVVLLSPACASYDMFNSYEERGKIFKSLVQEL